MNISGLRGLGAGQARSRTATKRPLLIIVGALATVAVLTVTGIVALQGRTIDQLNKALQVAEATPVCGSTVLDDVRSLLAAHHAGLAAERARTVLISGAKEVCPDDQPVLAALLYAAATDEFFERDQTSGYSLAADSAKVHTWQDLTDEARRLGVSQEKLLTPREVFKRAWESGQYAVADWAYRQAVADAVEAVSTNDRVDFLVAWGNVLADLPGAGMRASAKRALRTAVEVGDRWQVDVGQVCRFIAETYLAGSNCRALPYDETEPLLRGPHVARQ